MFKFDIILIVTCNFMVTVYAPRFFDENSFQSVKEARSELTELNSITEALPVVVIVLDQGTETERLEVADDILQVVAENKRMVNGTIFSLIKPNLGTQMFLCPVQYPDSSQRTCLAPRWFEPFEQLKCDLAPIPEAREDDNDETRKCGFKDAGIHYVVGFSICPRDENAPYRYTKNFLIIYGFCYAEEIQTILFTSHVIAYPVLLASSLLCREHELFSPPAQDVPFNYNVTYPAYSEYLQKNEDKISHYINYSVRNLVPNEDLPFGIWKATIHQTFNFEMMHNSLFRIWREIENKVRETAIRRANNPYNPVKFYIRTAVIANKVDIQVYGPTQIYNRWFKIVVAMSDGNVAESAVVLVMNNFIRSDFDFHPDQLTNLDIEMNKLCSGIGCAARFSKFVTERGGEVRCCDVTEAIAKLFGYGSISRLLRITAINL